MVDLKENMGPADSQICDTILNFPSFEYHIQDNVNPDFAKPWLIYCGGSPYVFFWLLKWHPPIQQPFGV